MKQDKREHSLDIDLLIEWLAAPSWPVRRKEQRLAGFAIALLGAKAALAAVSIPKAEQRLVANLVKDFTTLNDEEASVAAYFALLNCQSQKLVDIGLEIVLHEFEMENVLALVTRLSAILRQNKQICEGGVNYLYGLYLKASHTIRLSDIFDSAQKDLYCNAIFEQIKLELAGGKSADLAGRGLMGTSSNDPAQQTRTGSSLSLTSPSGRLVYSAQLMRKCL